MPFSSRTRMWRPRSIVAVVGLLGVLGIYVFWQYIPYQNESARQIRNALEGYGIQVTSLKVETLTGERAVLTQIELGKEFSLRASRLVADYNLNDVRRGKFDALEIDGPDLTLYERAGTWQIGGLEPFFSAKDKTSAPPALSDEKWLRTTLPSHVKATRGMFVVQSEGVKAKVPFEGEFSLSDNSTHLDMRSRGLSARAGKADIETGLMTLVATLPKDKAEWSGNLKSTDIRVTGLPETVPPLGMEGTFRLGKTLKSGLLFTDEKSQWKADLSLSLPIDAPNKGTLLISRLHFPWKDGVVSTENVQIALSGDKIVRVPLTLYRVDLASLLSETTGGKVKATGAVSGTVPVLYHPDGNVTIGSGDASATGEGELSVAPEILPGGDNQQLTDVRAALQNFHYTALKIQLLSEGTNNDKIKMQMTVEGNSPEAFEGRPVKLTVNLTGDVLPLIQQSLLPLGNPRELLRQQP